MLNRNDWKYKFDIRTALIGFFFINLSSKGLWIKFGGILYLILYMLDASPSDKPTLLMADVNYKIHSMENYWHHLANVNKHAGWWCRQLDQSLWHMPSPWHSFNKSSLCLLCWAAETDKNCPNSEMVTLLHSTRQYLSKLCLKSGEFFNCN